jgi:hypothetical protein
MNPITINFKRLKNLPENQLVELSKKMVNQKYSENEGYGFVLKNIDQKHIQAYLIIDIPSYSTSFDPVKLDVIKNKIIKKIAIEFVIDLNYNLLEVYSDKSNTNRLITELGKLSNFSIVVEDIQFKVKDIVKHIKQNRLTYTIKKLRIRDFSINEYTIGSFYANILASEEADRLITKYNNLITYVGLIYSIGKNDISLGIYDTGIVKLYNKTDESDEVLIKFKEVFFGRDQ